MANSGGDLGWFAEGKDEFNEACFSKRGELQIVSSQFGIHLIEVTKKNCKEVKIAFIDRNVVPSNETYQEIFTQAGKLTVENSNSESLTNQQWITI